MNYRCPLCLKLLNREDEVAKFCPRHRNANPDSFGPYDPSERDGGFKCSDVDCTSHKVVRPDGLLYRHVGCQLEVAPGVSHPSVNPFWNGTAVTIGEFVEITRNNTIVRQRVSHWEIEMLRQVSGAAASEMWFPAALLPQKGDRRHVLVSLTGAKNAGKTYLAMRALDPASYAQTFRPTDDFFFIHQGVSTSGDASDFLLTLYLRQLLRDVNPGEFATLLASTPQRPRNLKVALFPEAPAPPVAPWLFRKLGLGDIYLDLMKSLGPVGKERDASFRALMLYDLSGEGVETDAQDVLRHDGEMNVLAILLSIEDLIQGTTNPGTATTRERLNRIAQIRRTSNPSLRACLIITKCDLMTGARFMDERALRDAIRQLALNCGEALLVESLDSCGTQGATLDRVFFTARVRQGTTDELRGLEDFVLWCMV